MMDRLFKKWLGVTREMEVLDEDLSRCGGENTAACKKRHYVI